MAMLTFFRQYESILSSSYAYRVMVICAVLHMSVVAASDIMADLRSVAASRGLTSRPSSTVCYRYTEDIERLRMIITESLPSEQSGSKRQGSGMIKEGELRCLGGHRHSAKTSYLPRNATFDGSCLPNVSASSSHDCIVNYVSCADRESLRLICSPSD